MPFRSRYILSHLLLLTYATVLLIIFRKILIYLTKTATINRDEE